MVEEENETLEDLVKAFMGGQNKYGQELSLREAETMSGLSHQTLARWARGELVGPPSLVSLDKLATAMRVDRNRVRAAAGFEGVIPMVAEENEVMRLYQSMSPEERLLWLEQGRVIRRHGRPGKGQ
jgi:transcriptional regulator with XRE-family HTH domain